MTKREFASLAFKLVAVHPIVVAMQHLWSLGFLIQPVAGGSFQQIAPIIFGGFGSLAGLLVIGGALFFCSDSLAAWAFEEPDDKVAVSASLRDIQAVAFSVVGVLVVATALPGLAQFALVLTREWPSGQGRAKLHLWGLGAGAAARMALGIGLFFGGRGLSNFWFKLRSAGRPRPKAEAE